MQRFSCKWIAIAVMASGLWACANEGVGDPCIPESIPCDEENRQDCGFRDNESYIESSSVQCRSRLCIVHRLEGQQSDLADPRRLCEKDPKHPNCVTEQQLDQSVYCTCRCDGPKTSVEFCECPSGYACEEVLTLGGDGIKGSYCVRPTGS
jgi:hypothetical protein